MGQTKTTYYYDGADLVLEKKGTASTAYVAGPRIDEILTDSRKFSYQTDGQGSVLNLTDSLGAKSNTYSYAAYGSTKAQTGTTINTWLYTGRQYDSESGLYFNRNRYYSASLGKFITKDPIGLKGGDSNLYRYVWNQPSALVDPYGLWGLGVVASGSSEGGVGAAGAGGTVSAGSGIFGGGSQGLNSGGFTSAGGFAGGPGYGVGAPAVQSGGTSMATGAYSGVGTGGFITNATNVGQPAGPFNTYFVNTPAISFQFGESNGTWIFSVTAGPGLGASGGAYPTETLITWGQPSESPGSQDK